MKKLCILLALMLALSTLCACRETVPEEKTMTGIAATTTAQDSTEAYKPILNEFRRLVQAFHENEPLDYDAWEAIGFVEVSYYEYKEGFLGYAMKDINNDGIPELLLLSKEPAEPAINSLFTLKDGKPVNLGQYWSRHRAHLAAEGTIYTVGSSSAWSTYLDSYALEPGVAELTHLTEYYMDADDNEIPFWVKVVNGEKINIPEKDFGALLVEYEAPGELMHLEFISIEQ